MERILAIKIKSGNFKGQEPEFKTKYNLSDFKQVAILLRDLESHGAKIDKAVKEFKKGDSKFPW